MNNNVQVNLQFTANTEQTKAKFAELQAELHKISLGSTIQVNANQLKTASVAAKELQIHLNNAFNAQTGKLDLSKLNQSLSTAKTSLGALSSELVKIGPAGEQAFISLAQSVSMAERPIIGLGKKMSSLMTTFANTTKWMISSTVLNGFIRTISSAYNYAQDLNESLNNIRIVTGYNIDQMARFAVEANKAAKALSATTTEYTNASLIYYQQGLSDQQVKERTDVTIKMANVSRQSVEVVSDQMTAVWNNFYDGSKSLESYADALTALGAATASSTDEIAQGLEKFAAIADTVGLSYEYATAALATVTAQTRQSADVVGTAFKTLFARIQDLKLGETLEDGTTLGQYSEALNKVGINIKTTNGDLKEMDDILNEMGAKWKTLERDEQAALAKAVGGLRQYNQIIALMDNWDFMQENLKVVENSSGTLQRQADVYAESWEGASDRARAAAESIYGALIDDKFFIGLTNSFSSVLNSLNEFIDGIGGLKTVLMSIGTLFLTMIAGKISPALANLKHNFAIVFQSAATQARNMSQEMNQSIESALSNKSNNFSVLQREQLNNALQMNKARSAMTVVEKNLTNLERQRYNQELAILSVYQQESEIAANMVMQAQQKLDAAKQEWDLEAALNIGGADREKDEMFLAKQSRQAKDSYMNSMTGENLGVYNEANRALQQHRQATDEAMLSLEHYMDKLQESYMIEMEATNGSIENSNAIINVSNSFETYGNKLSKLATNVQEGKTGFNDAKSALIEIQSQVEMASGKSLPELSKAFDKAFKAGNNKALVRAIGEIQDKLKNAGIPAKDLEKILRNLGQGNAINKIKKGYDDLNKAAEELRNKQEAVNRAIQQFKPEHQVSKLEALSRTAAGLGSVAMAIQSIRSITQAWSNDDMSFGEKLTTTLMGISMLVPSIRGALTSFGTIISSMLIPVTQKLALSNYEVVASMTAQKVASKYKVSQDMAELLILQAKIKKEHELALSKGTTLAAMTAEQLAEKTGMTVDQASIVISKLKAGASLQEAMAEAGLTSAKSTGIIATIAATVANWGLFASMLPIVAVTLVLTAAIAALALIIWGVVSAVQAISDKYNAESIAAEKAAKTAKELAESYDEIKNKYENMIAAYDKYKDAKTALDELTRGTEEYKEALSKANEAAIELINTIPNSLTAVQIKNLYSWEDGELVINSHMEDLLKEMNAQKLGAEYASAYAYDKSSQLKQQADTLSMIRSLDNSGFYSDREINQMMLSNADNLVSMPLLEFIEQLEQYGIVTENISQYTLMDMQRQFRILANEADNAQAKLHLIGEAQIDQIVGDEYDGAAKTLAESKRAKDTEQREQKLLKQYTDNKNIDRYSTHENKLYQDILVALRKAGYEFEADKDNAVRGSSKNREFAFRDAEGKEVVKSAEWVAAVVGTQASLQRMEYLTEEALGVIQSINESDMTGKDFKNFISSNKFSSMTEEEFEYYNQLSNVEKEQWISKLFNNQSIEQIASDLEYNNKEELLQAVEQGFTITEGELKRLKQNTHLNDVVYNLLSDLNLENAGIETRNVLTDQLNDIYYSLGKEATVSVGNILKDMPVENADDFLEILNSMDWSTQEPEDFLKALDKTQLNFNASNDTLLEFINNWITFTESLTETAEKIANMQKLLNTTKSGDVLTKQDVAERLGVSNKKDLTDEMIDKYTIQLGEDKFLWRGLEKEITANNMNTLVSDAVSAQDKLEIESHTPASAAGSSDVKSITKSSASYHKEMRDAANDAIKTEVETLNSLLWYKKSDQRSIKDSNVYRDGNGHFRWVYPTYYAYEVDNDNPAGPTLAIGLKIETVDIDGESSVVATYSQDQLTGAVPTNQTNALNSVLQDVTQHAGRTYDINEELIDPLLNPLLNEGEVNKFFYEEDQARARLEYLDAVKYDGSELSRKEIAALMQKDSSEYTEDEISQIDQAYNDKTNTASQDYKSASDDATDAWEAVINQALFTNDQNLIKELLSGTYQGQTINLPYQHLNNLQSKATALNERNIANIMLDKQERLGEEAQLYAIRLQETAEASEILADSLANNVVQSGLVANNIIGIEQAFKNLADNDKYKNLFEEIYSGKYAIDSPEYMKSKEEFEQTLADFLQVDKDKIDLINIFSDISMQELLNEVMTGEIDYNAFVYKFAEQTHQLSQEVLQEAQNIADSLQVGETQVLSVTMLEFLKYATPEQKQILSMFGLFIDDFNKTITNLGSTQLINLNAFVEEAEKNIVEHIEKIKKLDVVERYKEVNDQIDNVSRAYENASKVADRLYGKARLNQMKEMNKILANEVDLLIEKRTEAEGYLQTDQADLNSIAQENIGLQFKFDQNTGDITNYQEVMDAVWKDYDAYYESAKSGGFTEEEQERLEDYDKAISTTKEAVAQYDETRELLEDIDDEIQAKLYEMQDNNYELFTYQIDMELEIRDLKLDLNQYKIDSIMSDLLEAFNTDKYAQNIYDLVMEGVDAYRIWNNETQSWDTANASRISQLQLDFAKGEAAFTRLKNGEVIAPEDMGISQADYADGLKNEYQYTMDYINALKEKDELMQSYYGDTLAAANEEIEKYTSLMEHSANVLDHYKNLMELTGKGTDYKKIGKILEGEAQVAADTLAVSTAIYEDRMNEANTAYTAYQEALTNGASEETLETLKNTWLTAQNAANEAQEQMLSDTEAWAEAQKAILENSLADLGKTLERTISGRFGSYDELSSAIERAQARTEEWLTTTNKVYETNKLINQAQKEIDKTTNTAAKRRLQNYIKETEQLQKQSKLSNFELEIQQAKYDLLLAEIALEEAQNAKSMVRLKRDKSGNFGYVYTADQNAIDEAQQKYEDADNALYNIRLEGANNYTQKSLELQMQFADTMQELNERRSSGEFATEQEYHNAVLAATEWYYAQLDDYSYLYTVAITEDTRIAADAWSTEFAYMITETNNWKTNVTQYITEVDKAFETWSNNITNLYGPNGALASIESGVTGIVNTASSLKELLVSTDGTGGIVNDAATASANALALATEYAKVRDTIVGEGGLIDSYEEQLEEITTLIENLSNLDNTSINVNQTQTYKTILDTGNFNASVKDFSAAVDRFTGGNGDENGEWNSQNTNPRGNQGAVEYIQSNTFLRVKAGEGKYALSHGYAIAADETGVTLQLDSADGKAHTFTWDQVEPLNDTHKDYWNLWSAYNDFHSFDTGGYTGEWGPEGKLALLHEKELILKPDDTSNFLSALGLLDNILLTLDKYSVSAQLGGLLSSPAFNMNNHDILEQNVHIEASFPGISDRNEIEEAFNNLINRASQYANRK